MSTDSSSPKPEGADAQRATNNSWLASLRARFGLAGPPTLRDTLEEALKEADRNGTAFSTVERDMFFRLLRFGALRVDDVMVPRADIIALDEAAPLSELLRVFKEAGVSRIPVFRETLDDPSGMVHIKDLFSYLVDGAVTRGAPPAAPPVAGGEVNFGKVDLKQPISAAKVRRSVLYVPPSMLALNLLIRMQATRIHMALVVDEYGGTDGLVTIEDLVEQVVGDIEDEHDVGAHAGAGAGGAAGGRPADAGGRGRHRYARWAGGRPCRARADPRRVRAASVRHRVRGAGRRLATREEAQDSRPSR
jgi:CBS domain containing-hemolysin-like protein